jgi:outer membrane protein OmpA-like peptidoglycan-associated protein
MRLHPAVVMPAIAFVLTGCIGNAFDSARDRTWGGELIEIPATTWIDPDGCEHWIFDTGAEGYATPKLNRDGTPVCGIESAAARSQSEVPGELTFNTVRQSSPTAFALDVDAYFDVDSARIRPAAFRELDAFFRYLQQINASRIVVSGHTDSQGTEAYNLDLSLRRANAVADYAQRFGITAISRGLGESAPIAPNDTPEGRALNRRVDVNVRN